MPRIRLLRLTMLLGSLSLLAGPAALAQDASPDAGGVGTPPAAAPLALPPDGAWQVELSSAEIADAGGSSEVWDGTYTWSFGNGRATIDVTATDGRTVECSADMRAIADDLLTLVYDYPGSCGGEIDVINWHIDDAGLLDLVLETTSAPLQDNAAYLEAKPWQPVAPAPSASTTPTAAP